MVDRFTPQLIELIQQKVEELPAAKQVKSGFEAALATVELMERTAKIIPPKDVVDVFIQAGGKKRVAVYEKLWEECGEKTAAVMADGAVVLAMIWRSAWEQGNGTSIKSSAIKEIALDRLMEFYTDPKFVTSVDLDDIGPLLSQP